MHAINFPQYAVGPDTVALIYRALGGGYFLVSVFESGGKLGETARIIHGSHMEKWIVVGNEESDIAAFLEKEKEKDKPADMKSRAVFLE